FGAPWITGYDREARITDAGFTVMEHYSRFNQPLLAGLGNLLFDYRIGLLRTAPLWFLWPIGAIIGWRTQPRATPLSTLALVAALSINLLFFARYDEWNASEFGNRFLFPAVAIGFALQAPLWRSLLPKAARPAE